eukprot:1150907-Pelagomonas_calceolata.AAC.1
MHQRCVRCFPAASMTPTSNIPFCLLCPLLCLVHLLGLHHRVCRSAPCLDPAHLDSACTLTKVHPAHPACTKRRVHLAYAAHILISVHPACICMHRWQAAAAADSPVGAVLRCAHRGLLPLVWAGVEHEGCGHGELRGWPLLPQGVCVYVCVCACVCHTHPADGMHVPK